MKLVPAKKLESGMVVALDVFNEDNAVSPYIRRGAVLTGRMIDGLLKHAIRSVYISDGNEGPLEELLPQVEKAPPTIAPELQSEAIASLENIFEAASITEKDIHVSSAQLVTELDDVVHRLVESILVEEGALVNINDLKSYDDYTFHHSLSVAVLSIAIGEHLGLRGKRLNQLGMCAMMHDIGKTAIPVEIVRKPAKLDAAEWQLMQTHSSAGFSYLNASAIGGEEVRLGVLSHHEKVDGSGYPNNLKGRDIPLFGRIIAVADVYDALTSNRPYRQPMQAADALEYIMGGVNTFFDYDMASALLRKIDLYPRGSCVELSDGRFAIVLAADNPMRPIVQVIVTNEVIDLAHERRALNLVVRRMVPEEELMQVLHAISS